MFHRNTTYTIIKFLLYSTRPTLYMKYESLLRIFPVYQYVDSLFITEFMWIFIAGTAVVHISFLFAYFKYTANLVWIKKRISAPAKHTYNPWDVYIIWIYADNQIGLWKHMLMQCS